MKYSYNVIYTKRKSILLKFDENGELIVRAPYFTSKKEIERLIEKNKTKLEDIRLTTLNRKEAFNNCNQAELEEKLKAIVLPLIEYYKDKIGVTVTKIRFSNAKKRLGSCSADGAISFSRYLALYPESAIEYVVVHELCHRIHMNHSKLFYSEIEKHLPDYKERKKLLKI